MKERYFVLAFIMAFFCFVTPSFGQTNTFPYSGSAGIGTTSPEMGLHIDVGSDNLGLIKAEADGTVANLPVIRFEKTGSGNNFDLDYFWNDERLEFQYNDDVIMAIKSSGDVGIGTASPAATLHLSPGDMALSSSSGDPASPPSGVMILFVKTNSSTGDLELWAKFPSGTTRGPITAGR